MQRACVVLVILIVLAAVLVLSPIKTLEKHLNLKTWEISGKVKVLGIPVREIDYTMSYADRYSRHTSLAKDKLVLASVSRGWLWSDTETLNLIENVSLNGPASSYIHCALLADKRGTPEYISQIVRLSEAEIAELEEKMWKEHE